MGIQLRTGNPTQLGAAPLAGDIDAALVAESRFDSLVAFEEEPVIVTGGSHPPVDRRGGVPETVIVFEAGCPHRQRLEQWYAARGGVPRRTIELGSYHAMLGCVLAGMGAALLPRSVPETFPEARRPRIHRLPAAAQRLRTLLVWRKVMAAPNVSAPAEILERPPGGRGKFISGRKV